jgi:hypothetical protein
MGGEHDELRHQQADRPRAELVAVGDLRPGRGGSGGSAGRRRTSESEPPRMRMRPRPLPTESRETATAGSPCVGGLGGGSSAECCRPRARMRALAVLSPRTWASDREPKRFPRCSREGERRGGARGRRGRPAEGSRTSG